MRYGVGVSVAAAAVALAASGPAAASPWDGGWEAAHPVEVALTDTARGLVNKPNLLVVCNSPEQWAYLGQSATTWGFVNFQYSYYGGWQPSQVAWLAPQTCLHLERFWQAPDKTTVTTSCVIGLTTEYETQAYRVRIKKRIRVKGKWVIRRVWVTRYREVPVQTPMYAECPDYIQMLFALQTLSHETMHLFGVIDEGLAECYGMQFLASTAYRLGATPALASRLASDYYARYYRVYTPGSQYFRADCVDGSAIDLDPSSPVFPRDYAAPFEPPPFVR